MIISKELVLLLHTFELTISTIENRLFQDFLKPSIKRFEKHKRCLPFRIIVLLCNADDIVSIKSEQPTPLNMFLISISRIIIKRYILNIFESRREAHNTWEILLMQKTASLFKTDY